MYCVILMIGYWLKKKMKTENLNNVKKLHFGNSQCHSPVS